MNIAQKLSDTELEVMEVIWEQENPVTSSELLQVFADKGRQWKSQTISTFLSRLVEKQYLRIASRKGRTNSYAPCLSKADYKIREAQDVLNGYYEGSVRNMVSALYDGEKLSDEDIDELKKWLSKK
ncbi:BlaI/MecI/CopY family transcriptional regulator [Aureibacillus halotolerans]|uniref:BlaI family penicillinase repressor n=1 Tax=Aureibacillus halotolerans TaxID=1508390 RepID=A0A4R6U0M8_9BACI|nr:BlaI/MecI/CopY family transcriptional regulator [Aureibacillus halotolerans]TDQ36604.1 BlaI family penicillinase repressor [Aureibacillus halotolerans]